MTNIRYDSALDPRISVSDLQPVPVLHPRIVGDNPGDLVLQQVTRIKVEEPPGRHRGQGDAAQRLSQSSLHLHKNKFFFGLS